MTPADLPAPIALGALRVVVGAASDVGPVRRENQDRWGVRPGVGGEASVFVVADGMGGHEAGAEASEAAVETLLDTFAAHYVPGASGVHGIGPRLRTAVEAANADVWKRANTGRPRRMGTTVTALALREDRAVLAHVGDSRAYRIDGATALAVAAEAPTVVAGASAESDYDPWADALAQLSRDHTLAEALKGTGDPRATGSARHALTRAVGIEAEVQVDVTLLDPARPGDRFVLCSDGLAPVAPAEIARAACAYPPQDAAEWLVALANAGGGRDNVTVVVVHILPKANGIAPSAR